MRAADGRRRYARVSLAQPSLLRKPQESDRPFCAVIREPGIKLGSNLAIINYTRPGSVIRTFENRIGFTSGLSALSPRFLVVAFLR